MLSEPTSSCTWEQCEDAQFSGHLHSALTLVKPSKPLRKQSYEANGQQHHSIAQAAVLHLDHRFVSFWRETIIKPLIPGIWLELAKLVPLRNGIFDCRVYVVMAPMHFPYIQRKMHAKVCQHLIGPCPNCKSQASCAYCAALVSLGHNLLTKTNLSAKVLQGQQLLYD